MNEKFPEKSNKCEDITELEIKLWQSYSSFHKYLIDKGFEYELELAGVDPETKLLQITSENDAKNAFVFLNEIYTKISNYLNENPKNKKHGFIEIQLRKKIAEIDDLMDQKGWTKPVKDNQINSIMLYSYFNNIRARFELGQYSTKESLIEIRNFFKETSDSLYFLSLNKEYGEAIIMINKVNSKINQLSSSYPDGSNT